jgi:hypothetical protein
MVNLSHASQKGHASRGFMIDYCALKCSADKLASPVNYLRSEFIRPEDLDLYSALGFSSFKILERGAPTEVLAKRVRAYTERRFDGNLLELIQPYGYKTSPPSKTAAAVSDLRRFLKYFFRPSTVRQADVLRLKTLAEKRGLLKGLDWDPVYLDNRSLDGFLAGLSAIDCRQTDCAVCGYCAHWCEKAVRVDEGYRVELLALYREAFDRMYDGSMWGVSAQGREDAIGK